MLIEGATAALFLLCLLVFGLTVEALGAAVLCWLLLGLSATDAETLLLPDAMTLPGIALGVLYSGCSERPGPVVFSWKMAAWSLLAAAGGMVLILAIRGVYWLVRRREGIGLGDAKLLAMIAAWLGFRLTGLTLFLATVSAALYGLGLILMRRTRHGTAGGEPLAVRIPLGAFLCGAGIFSLFQGKSILSWYLQFFR